MESQQEGSEVRETRPSHVGGRERSKSGLVVAAAAALGSGSLGESDE